MLEGCSPTGCMWFTGQFLRYWALDPVRLLEVRIRDDAMEPTLPINSGAVVDLRRREWETGALYGVRPPDGGEPVVRRATEDGGGQRMLTVNRGEAPAQPWTEDEALLGRVVWAARMFLPPPSG